MLSELPSNIIETGQLLLFASWLNALGRTVKAIRCTINPEATFVQFQGRYLYIKTPADMQTSESNLNYVVYERI